MKIHSIQNKSKCILKINIYYKRSRGKVVSIVTIYGLDNRWVGVQVLVRKRIFTSPYCPDRLWGTPTLLSNGYQGLFLWEYSGRGIKLTTHLQLVPRPRKRGPIHPFTHTSSWRSV
jgi:hypothetical protein